MTATRSWRGIGLERSQERDEVADLHQPRAVGFVQWQSSRPAAVPRGGGWPAHRWPNSLQRYESTGPYGSVSRRSSVRNRSEPTGAEQSSSSVTMTIPSRASGRRKPRVFGGCADGGIAAQRPAYRGELVLEAAAAGAQRRDARERLPDRAVEVVPARPRHQVTAARGRGAAAPRRRLEDAVVAARVVAVRDAGRGDPEIRRQHADVRVEDLTGPEPRLPAPA